MFPSSVAPVYLILAIAGGAMAQYSATYLPDTAPATTEEGQTGTNKCGTESSQSSMCQNAYINAVDDFCLWAPPEPGADSQIGTTERIEVAWCLKSGYGTRVIPDGTITGAHFVKTPDFVQITGIGDLTKMNIPAGNDGGGELDPHGADGNGNPIGGLVFSSAFGNLEQIHEWTNFMSNTEFCFRACNPAGSDAPGWCQHIYDVMGCDWNMPGNYDSGIFESCDADSGQQMGVYGGSTFHQGDASTPAAHPIPSSSNCQPVSTIGGGVAASFSASSSSFPATTSHKSSASATSVSSSSSAASSILSSLTTTRKIATLSTMLQPTVSTAGSGSTPTSTSPSNSAFSVWADVNVVYSTLSALLSWAIVYWA